MRNRKGEQSVLEEEQSKRWTWSLLVWLAPVLIGATFLSVLLVVFRELDPFVLGIVTILFVAALVGWRLPRRAGPITVLVILVLLLLLFVPSLLEDLAHPESALTFIFFGIVPLALITTGIIASIAALTSRSDAAASVVAYAAGIIIVVGAAIGIIATLGVEDDTALSGDVELVAEKVEFSPDALSAEDGSVGVFVDNRDPIRHTFAIEELDIEVELPANTARHVTISAPPGTYDFVCTVPGHENMRGTLTVGS